LKLQYLLRPAASEEALVKSVGTYIEETGSVAGLKDSVLDHVAHHQQTPMRSYVGRCDDSAIRWIQILARAGHRLQNHHYAHQQTNCLPAALHVAFFCGLLCLLLFGFALFCPNAPIFYVYIYRQTDLYAGVITITQHVSRSIPCLSYNI
jgi:hypothetical protein